MHKDIEAFNNDLPAERKEICELLAKEIQKTLPEATSKLWHGAPVWFIKDNPIVGYDSLKNGIRLLFWSGQSFDEPGLQPEGTFKAAEVRYTSKDQVDSYAIARWLEKAKLIQWDYKNIVKRKGKLERIEPEM